MENTRPQREIRAVYTDSTIRVYQAYNSTIAAEAVKNGTFGSHFSMTRMTWIKPSFLWMMYRSGWGEKEGQEHILAIDIKREGFDTALRSAVASSYREDMGITREQWQESIKSSDVRIQWDPEKDIHGNDLDCRSVQIGLRGKAVHDYVYDWIVSLTDITEEVRRLDAMRKQGIDISSLLPDEKVYTPG